MSLSKVRLYNTLGRKKEIFSPLNPGEVRLYTCGPTVYDFAHIGNLRTYLFEDVLRRTLEYAGYRVRHAMNITDVGHLVGDEDGGEDKMEIGARREGKNPLTIAKFYTEQFFEDANALNIIRPDKILPATESIEEQIEIIKTLEQKGFIYQGEQAVYFDTSRLSDYGKLSGQKLQEKKTGAREEVVVDKDKKHPADFALWFFLTGRYRNHILHWPSPWGEGFPGWHIECSAISRKLLGQPFDIHCGGVDHVGVHHTNEIAQSEAAFDAPLCRYWLHGEFLLIDAGRMGKSEGNTYTLRTIIQRGLNPLSYRFLCLTAHYRSQLNFTWEALEGAENALKRLERAYLDLGKEIGKINENYQETFKKHIFDDLDTPGALTVVWNLLKDDGVSNADKKATLLDFDKVFGLGLADLKEEPVPEEIKKLAEERELARRNKDFKKSDELRDKINREGYELKDLEGGYKINKIR
jgi:cysteinyl-tRNA synthetase